MKQFFSTALRLAMGLLLLVSTASYSADLKTLEDIAAKAPNLDTFLNNRSLVDEYFQAAKDYYGADRFPREMYDAILEQLGRLAKTEPEVAERLWQTFPNEEPIRIKSEIKTSGRKISQKRWKDYLKNWTEELRQQAEPYLKMPSDEAEAKIDSLTGSLDRQIAEYDHFVPGPGITAREFGEKKGQFFQNLKANEELKRASSYYLYRYLMRETVQDHLRSGDADLALDTLESIREQPVSVLNNSSRSVQTSLKSIVPSRQALLADEKMFPAIKLKTRRGRSVALGATADSPIEFHSVPRRFHGIFKGIPLKECVGGEKVEHLTPERWATIALKDSRLYHVTRGGSYLGFVQEVPIQKNGKIYASVDFGAQVLRQKIFVQSPDGSKTQTSLAEEWLSRETKRLPRGWNGFVLGESSAIDNAGVLDTLKSSPSYAFGKEIGDSSEFKHIDPLAKTIVRRSPTSELIKNYGGRMIFDAFVPNAGTLTVLSPDDARKIEKAQDADQVAKLYVESREKKKDALLKYAADRGISSEKLSLTAAKDIGPRRSEGIVAYFKKLKTAYPGTIQHLTRLSDDKNPNTAKNADEILGYLNVTAKSKPAEVTEELIQRLSSQDKRVRASALNSLAKIAPSDEKVISKACETILSHPGDSEEAVGALSKFKSGSRQIEETFATLLKKANASQPGTQSLIEATVAYRPSSPAVYQELTRLLAQDPYHQPGAQTILTALEKAPSGSINEKAAENLKKVRENIKKVKATVRPEKVPGGKVYFIEGIGITPEDLDHIDKTAAQATSGSSRCLVGAIQRLR